MSKFIFDLQRFADNELSYNGESTGNKYTLNGKTYATAEAALATLEAGATVTLTTDVTSEGYTEITKSITINLGGKTWTVGKGLSIDASTSGDATRTVTIKNGNLTGNQDKFAVYMDGSDKFTLNIESDAKISSNRMAVRNGNGTVNLNGGTLTSTASSQADVIWVAGETAVFNMNSGKIIADNSNVSLENATDDVWGVSGVEVNDGGTFNMYGGTITTTLPTSTSGGTSQYQIIDGGVSVWNDSTFNMTGGEITVQNYFAVTGNGTESPTSANYGANTTISITGNSKITSANETAIYHPQINGKITIGDTTSSTQPTISGKTGAIEIRAGELTVNGGTLSCTNTDENNSYSYHWNGSGSTTTNAAIAVAQHTTKKATKVTINGGTIQGTGSGNSAVALSVANPEADDYPVPEITINGGTFIGTDTSVTNSTTETETNYIPTAINVSDSRATVNFTGENETTIQGQLNAVNQYVAEGKEQKTNASVLDAGGRYSFSQSGADNIIFTSTSGSYNGSDAATKSIDYIVNVDSQDPKETASGSSKYKLAANSENIVSVVYYVNDSSTNPITQTYTSLNAALEALSSVTIASGTAIQLTMLANDATFSGSYTLSSNYDLDLNGYTVTSAAVTAFTVSTGSTFRIWDSSSAATGTLTGAKNRASNDTAALIVNQGTFQLESGTLSAKYMALNNSGTADISGKNASIVVNNTLDSGDAITNTGTLNLGIQSNPGGVNPLISLTSSSSTDTLIAAISDSGTVNVYGANIVANSTNVNGAAIYSEGQLNIEGGSIAGAASSGLNYYGVQVNSSVLASIAGANIDGQTYGVYDSGGEAGITFFDGGNVINSVAKSSASGNNTSSDITFGTGGTYDGSTATDENSYYSSTAGGDVTYTFNNANLAAQGSGGIYWQYTRGASTTAETLGTGTDTITFKGDLFDSTKLGNADISVSDGKVSINNTNAFTLGEGKYLQIADTDTNHTLVASGLATAGAYNNYAELQVTTDEENAATYSYKSAGADYNGFIFDESGTGVMTYHTVRADEFTFGAYSADTGSTGTMIAFASDVSDSGAAYGALFDISTSGTLKTVTITDPNQLFASVQSAGTTLMIKESDYTLTIQDGKAATMTTIASFKAGEETTIGTEESPETITPYTYIASGGAIDSSGAAADGYTVSGGVVGYVEAAKTFSFKGGEGYAAWSSLGADWFTIDTVEGGAYNITIGAGALSSTQAEGAQLMLVSTLSGGDTYALSYENVTVEGTYNSVATFADNGTVTGGYGYTYGSAGNDSQAGFTLIDNIATWHDKAATISLTSSAALSTPTSDSVSSNFALNGTTLTILQSSLFGSDALKEGFTIGVSNDTASGATQYSLALSQATIGDAGSDSASPMFNILDSSDQINTVAAYDTSTNTYTGKGANEAGWESVSGTSFAYHQQYDSFTFEHMDFGTAAGFATLIGVVAPSVGAADASSIGTITINQNALTGTPVNGAYMQLDSASGAQYNLAIGDLEEANYQDASFTATNQKRIVWKSAGGDAAGYALSTVEGSEGNDRITYYDAQTQLVFAMLDGETMNFASDAASKITLGETDVTLGRGVFGTQPTGDGAVILQYQQASGSSINKIVLADDFGADLLTGNVNTTATFDGTTYQGQGSESGEGYQLIDDTSVGYFTKAKSFSVEGSLALVSDSTVMSDLFDISGNSVTIKSAAIADGAESGQTLKTSSSDYTAFAFENALGADNVSTLNSVTSNGLVFEGIGGKTGAGVVSGSDSLFTYYAAQETFTLAAGSVAFDTTQSGETLSAALAAGISITEENNAKVITITDSSILDLSNLTAEGKGFGLDSSQQVSHDLKIGEDSGLASLSTDNIHTAATLMSGDGDNSYTYRSAGADSLGYVGAGEDSYTFYKKVDTIDITSSIPISLSAASVGTDGNFQISDTDKAVTITSGLFGGTGYATLNSLSGGETFVLGGLNGSTVKYALVLGSDLDTVTMSTAATFETVGAVGEGNTAHMYTFAGANKDGFVVDNASVGSITFQKQAEHFTLEGSLALSTVASSLFYPVGASNPKAFYFLSDAAFSGATTGQTIGVLNEEGGTQYTLLKGSNQTAAQDYRLEASFTQDDDGGYTYKSKGASVAGVVENSTIRGLTYYGKREFEFGFDDGVSLNTTNLTLEGASYTDESLSIRVESLSSATSAGESYSVTLDAAVIDANSLVENESVLKLSDTYDAKYQLVYGGTDTVGAGQSERTLSQTAYHGVGAETVGWGQANSTVDTFTYYGTADRFTIGGGIQFTTIGAGTGTNASAWTDDQLTEAIGVDHVTQNGVTTATFTIKNLGVFDSVNLTEGNTVSLASGVGSQSDTKFALKIADDLTIADSTYHSQDVVSVDSTDTTKYTYTFKGADEAGFTYDDNNTPNDASDDVYTYHKKSDTFEITSQIPLNLDSINTSMSTVFSVAPVGGSTITGYTLTINEGALNMDSLVGGETITVGTLNELPVTLTLGTSLHEYTGDSVATWGQGTTTLQHTFTEAGAPANSFTFNDDHSVLTYKAPANSVVFDANVAFSSDTDATIAANNITFDNGVVSIGAGLLSSTQADGNYITLNEASQKKYTLDLSALEIAGNTYNSADSFANNTYTGKGMSSVDGYYIVGDDTATARATWRDKSEILTFKTSGNFAFNSDAAKVAENISIGDDHTVTIKSAAFTSDSLQNNSSLVISNGRENDTVGYSVVIDGWDSVSGYHDASFNATSRQLTTAGATTPGYTLSASSTVENAPTDTVTWITSSEVVTFTGNIAFAEAATTVAQNVAVNGKNVIVQAAAFSSSLAGNGTETFGVHPADTYNLVFGEENGSDLELLTNDGNTKAKYENYVYQGIGANKEGFTNDGTTYYYWKAYDTFTIDSASSDLVLNPGTEVKDYITVDNKVITIKDDALTKTADGQVLKLAEASKEAGYTFALIDGAGTVTAADITTAATFATVNDGTVTSALYTAEGSTLTGYQLSTDADSLTYRKRADQFRIVMVDSSGNEVTAPWASLNTPDITGDGTVKSVAFDVDLIDPTKLKGDGTETFKIVAMDENATLKNDNTYKLVNNAWGVVQDTVAGSFDATTKTLTTSGAQITGDAALGGFKDEDGSLTYFRAPVTVTLGGTAEFDTVASDKVSDYFNVVEEDQTVTLQKNIFDIIKTSEEGGLPADGTTLTLKTEGYKFVLGDSVQAAGSYSSVKSFSGVTYTGPGMQTSGSTIAAAGFSVDDTTSAALTYHGLSDKVTFLNNTGYLTNWSTNAANNITVQTVLDSVGAETKYVKVGADAFTTLTEGGSIGINTTSTDAKYKLYTTVDEENKTVGDLTWAGSYNSSNTFGTVVSGTGSDTTTAYAYTGKGADQNGFVVAASGTNSILTYHTAREDEFTLSFGDTPIDIKDNVAAATAAGYFTISGSDGNKTVTVNTTQLFETSQVGGASVQIKEVGYTLAVDKTVGWSDSDTFVTSSRTYTFAGATDNGYKAEDGVVKYYDKADSFTFDTGVTFNTNYASGWFDVTDADNGIIKVNAAALSTVQTDGAQISITSAGYTVAAGDDLIADGNTYNSMASFATTEGGGGTYTTKGNTKANGFVEITSGEGADATSSLVYHTVGSDLKFTGNVMFNDLAYGSVESAIVVDGTKVTLTTAALADTQENGATLNAAGYQLVLGDSLAASGVNTVATFAGNVYKSKGAEKAGYTVSGAAADNTLTFYDTLDQVTFTGTATFDTAQAAANIEVTTTTDENGKKIVTVSPGALTSASLTLNKTLRISDTSKYSLVAGGSLDGGYYNLTTSFVKDATDSVTGVTTYNYLYGGAQRDGFVKTSSTSNYLTYKKASEQIGFEGTLEFTDTALASPTVLAGYFTPEGTTISISGSAFSDGIFSTASSDNASLKVSNGSYTLTGVDLSNMPSGEVDTATLIKGSNSYTYSGTGASSPGYKISDNALVYRAPIDKATFTGDLVLDTTAVDAIVVDTVGDAPSVTISKSALGSQTAASATIKLGDVTRGGTAVTGATLAFDENNKPDEWIHSDATLSADKTTYSTEGYSQTGYQLANNEITYHEKDVVDITFSGLSTEAKVTDLTYDSTTATFTLDNGALKDATNRVDGGEISVTGDYHLALKNAADLAPVETEKGFDSMESGATTATYHNTYNTGGYAVNAEADNKIDFTAKVEKSTLFTLTGVGTIDGITVGDTGVITATSANIADGAKNVSVEGTGYTLTLTGIDTAPTYTSTDGWAGLVDSSNSAKYERTTTSTCFWTASDDNTSYSKTCPETTYSTLFTITGIKSTLESSAIGTNGVVSVESTNIADNANTVVVDGTGYTLALSGVDTVDNTTVETTFSAVADNKSTCTKVTTTNEYWTAAADSKSYTKTQEAGTTSADLFIISGVANTDSIAVSDDNVVTAYASNLADGATSVMLQTTGNYTLTLSGVDTTQPDPTVEKKFGNVESNAAKYEAVTTIGEYWTRSSDGKLYSKTNETSTSAILFTLNGVASVSDSMVTTVEGGGYAVNVASTNLAAEANEISLTKGADVTDTYTLALGEDLPTVPVDGTTTKDFGDVDTTAHTVKYIATTPVNDYWKVDESDSNKYTLTKTADKTEDLFTLTGVSSKEGITVDDDGNVKINGANLVDQATPVVLSGSDSYKLVIGDNITEAESITEKYDASKMTYNTAGKSAGYSVSDDGKTLSYADTTSITFQFSDVADGAETSNFSLSEKELTIAKAAVKTDGTALTLESVSDGGTYNLKLGGDMDEAKTYTAATYDSTAMTYNTKGSTVGYLLGDNAQSISYNPTATSTTFQFSGVADAAQTSNFYLNAKTNYMTIGKEAVKTDGTVLKLESASDGGTYNLKLGSGMDEGKTYDAATYDSTAMTYNTKGTITGYVLSDDAQSISYNANTTSTTFQFSGVADGAETGNFYLNAKTKYMTIGQAAVKTDGTVLKLENVSDGGTYNLKLGSGMDAAKTYDAATYDSTAMTYNTAGTTEGYVLSSDAQSISYNPTATSTTFQFSGVADDAETGNFSLSGTDMTISQAAVKTDGTALTLDSVSDGGTYNLKLGEGMDEGKTYDAATYDSTAMTYNTAGTIAGYVLSSDAQSISYNADTTSTTFQFSGVADAAETGNFYLNAKTKYMTIGKDAVKTDGTALTLTNVSDGETYNLKLGSGMDEGKTYDAATYDSSNMTYNTKGTITGYVLSDDAQSISYNADTTSTTFQFSGVADAAETGNFYLNAKTNYMTIGQAAVKTDGTVLSLDSVSDGGTYNLKLGSGMDAAKTYDTATYDSSTMTYNTKGTIAGYVLSDDAQSISYNAENTSKTFQFSGVADGAETSNFYLNAKTKYMTIGQAAVKTDGTVLSLDSVSDGETYNLKLGSGMDEGYTYSKATYNADNMTYNTKGTVAGYVLSDDAQSISYNANTTATTFQFSGVADGAETGNFYLNAKTKYMTIGKDAVKTDGTVLSLDSVSDGETYNLKLGSGMDTGKTYDTATYDSSNMTYNTKGTVAGYVLSDDAQSISYNANTTSKTFQFSGVADGAQTSNFYLNAKTKYMTIGKDAVKTDGTVLSLDSVSDGETYNLKLGSGMDTSKTYDTATYDSTAMTYNTKGTVAGYVLGDDAQSIYYNAENTSKTFQFSGVADGAETSNFYLNAKTKYMTIGKNAVKTDGTVLSLDSVSDGETYNLKLGSGMSTSKTYDTATYNSSNMTYNTKGTTEGYVLSDDAQSIYYNEATSKTFQFSGVADGAETSNFYLKNNVMTIGKAAVKTDGTALTLDSVSDGGTYTLKLGKGMSGTTTETETSLASGTFSVNEVTAGYALGTDSLSVTYESSSDTTLKLTGVASEPTISGKNVAITTDTFDTKLTVSSNTGSFTFSVAEGDYSGKTFAGSAGDDTVTSAGASLIISTAAGDDSIVNSGDSATLSGGNGNDYISNTGLNVSINGGAGADTILGGTSADILVGGTGNDSMNGGAGNDTLNGGADDDYLLGGAGADSLFGGAGNDTMLGGEGNDTMLGGAGDDYLEGGAGVDHLYAGAGNDTLWGGAGNDSLTGGDGADTFIYKPNEGGDSIFNFGSEDILYLLDTSNNQVGFTNSSFNSTKGTLTIAVEGGGKVYVGGATTSDTFNINGTTYGISGGKLVEK